MAARLSASMRHLASVPSAFSRCAAPSARRSFGTTHSLRQDALTTQRRPIGGFRGTLFGFLLGSVLAGGGLYYYVIDEYKVSNELLTQDIYALQAAVQRLEGYVRGIEEEQKSRK